MIRIVEFTTEAKERYNLMKMYVHFLVFLLALLLLVVFATTSEEGGVYNESDYKDEAYEDSSEENETTQAPVICATNFTYTYARNILNVSFIPAYPGSNYLIKLIAESEAHDSSKMTSAVQPLEVVTFENNDVVQQRNYIVEIFDSLIPCMRFKSQPFFLGAYKTFIDCNLWQVTMYSQPNPYERMITASFDPYPEFASCFEVYIAELGWWNNSTIYQWKNVTYNNHEMKVTFSNLLPGKYRVRIIPKHEDCPPNGCFNRSFSVIELKELKKKGYTLPNKNEDNNLVVVTVATCVVILIIVVAIISAIMRLVKQHNPIFQLATIKSSKATVPPDSISNCKEKLIVHMLSAEDIEKQNKVSKAIKNFLKECCKAESVKDGNSAEVFISNPAWIQNHFDYKFSRYDKETKSNNTKYKIVIVETDAAVKLYEAWLHLMGCQQCLSWKAASCVAPQVFKTCQQCSSWKATSNGSPQGLNTCEQCTSWKPTSCGAPEAQALKYLEYDHMNDLFIRGLNLLTSNPEFRGTDHYQIVVIRFPYFFSVNKLACLKQKRLYLPHRVVELYNSLWDKDDLCDREDTLMNEWKQTNSYKELLRATEEMTEYVKNNPNYLNEYVFGDSQVV